MKAVVDWPTPVNLTETRAFVALASYYRRHIRGFADIARPLHELTRKGRRFSWEGRQQQAFDKLKQCLVTAPVFSPPRSEGAYILDTDASNEALGAVLHQEQDGDVKVIAYASRALSGPERSYCTTRKELAGVIFGLKQFRHYLLATPFVLRVDHAALISLQRTPEPVGQQARWLDLISQFNFRIVHRPGSQHTNSDSPSRRPCERAEGSQQCGQCSHKTETNVAHADGIIRAIGRYGEIHYQIGLTQCRNIPPRQCRNIPTRQQEHSAAAVQEHSDAVQEHSAAAVQERSDAVQEHSARQCRNIPPRQCRNIPTQCRNIPPRQCRNIPTQCRNIPTRCRNIPPRQCRTFRRSTGTFRGATGTFRSNT